MAELPSVIHIGPLPFTVTGDEALPVEGSAVRIDLHRLTFTVRATIDTPLVIRQLAMLNQTILAALQASGANTSVPIGIEYHLLALLKSNPKLVEWLVQS